MTQPPTPVATVDSPTVPVHLRVNGRPYDLRLPPQATLLDTLRDTLGLTGTKKVCDMGQCGACTVLCDGVAIYACLKLAIESEGCKITTIEGLTVDGTARSIPSRNSSCNAMRCNAASARRGKCWRSRRCGPARQPHAHDDPARAGREPVPLRSLRRDHARRPGSRPCPGPLRPHVVRPIIAPTGRGLYPPPISCCEEPADGNDTRTD